MLNYEARRGRIWLNVVITVVILCGTLVWTGGNSPVAEDAQPNLIPSVGEGKAKAATKPQANAPKGPDIFFPETKHDFGKVFVGNRAEHVFKYTNRGNAVLNISEITVGCECTGIKLNKWKLAPGEEGEMLLTFTPSSKTRTGKTAKFAYVNSNDPDTPRFKLQFNANVRKDVIFTPDSFELGLVPKGNTGAVRLVLKSKLNPEDFEITKVVTFDPSVGVSYGKQNDKGEWYVEASIKKDAVLGKQAGSIAVHTNSVKQPEIKIPTFAEVVKEVTAVPKGVCFGRMPKGNEVLRSLTIFHAKGIKVEKVEPSLSWVSVDIAPPSDDNTTKTSSTEVKLKLSSDNAPNGKSEGVLSIYTNSQEIPVLKVHLCCNVL